MRSFSRVRPNGNANFSSGVGLRRFTRVCYVSVDQRAFCSFESAVRQPSSEDPSQGFAKGVVASVVRRHRMPSPRRVRLLEFLRRRQAQGRPPAGFIAVLSVVEAIRRSRSGKVFANFEQASLQKADALGRRALVNAQPPTIALVEIQNCDRWRRLHRESTCASGFQGILENAPGKGGAVAFMRGETADAFGDFLRCDSPELVGGFASRQIRQ